MIIAKELISNAIVPLKTSDSGVVALQLFDEFRLMHLPVVSDGQLVGLISEDDVFSAGNFEEPIWNYRLQLQNVSILHSKHIHEAIKIIAENKLTVLPVVDEKENYMGVITLAALVEQMANMSGVRNPGGILVLELNINDYSMVEIARIIEENDTKILSLYVNSTTDSTKMELTLKLNKMDIHPVVQSFLRYDYVIKASFFESDYFEELHDRYNNLMNYLNI